VKMRVHALRDILDAIFYVLKSGDLHLSSGERHDLVYDGHQAHAPRYP
jgi:hypothetical protein